MEAEKDLLYNLNNCFRASEEYPSWELILESLELYEKWVLDTICSFSGRRNYSDEHVAQQIFSVVQISKSMAKIHVIAIHECIKELKTELEKAKGQFSVTEKYVKGKLALLRDIVLDSYEFIGYCEKNFLNKPLTKGLVRRRKFASNEIFNCSRELLRRNYSYDDITFSSIPVFLIRQAIETKVLNSLGIHAINDSSENPVKFKIERIIEFITENEKIEFPINKSILLKISKWTNFYIHSGVMDFHWKIIWAHKILKPLFSMGMGKTVISIYGSVKIDRNYYEYNLENDLLNYLDLKGAKIIKIRPEAIIE